MSRTVWQKYSIIIYLNYLFLYQYLYLKLVIAKLSKLFFKLSGKLSFLMAQGFYKFFSICTCMQVFLKLKITNIAEIAFIFKCLQEQAHLTTKCQYLFKRCLYKNQNICIIDLQSFCFFQIFMDCPYFNLLSVYWI